MRTVPIRETDALDYRHPVDYIEPEIQERSEQADALLAVVFWMMRTGTTAKVQVPAHMGARVWVLAVALGVESLSWAEIGRRCGLSREGVRLMAKELENEFGLRSINARTDQARFASLRARRRVVEGKDK